MITPKPDPKDITACRSHTSLLSVLIVVALLGAAPRGLADCDCESPWVIDCGEHCILTADCKVERLTISYGGRLDTGNYTLTITGSGGLTICAGGLLKVEGNGMVVLNGGGTSPLNGRIELEQDSSTLKIADSDHTLTGSGAIEGQNADAQILITDGETLTSEITIQGALTIDDAAGASATFTNHGLVHANRTSADWVLDVKTATTNDNSGNRWKVSAHQNAELRFSSAATGLGGDFTVSNGKLRIDENVTTTGDLSFTGGKIVVASGCSAKFSQTPRP